MRLRHDNKEMEDKPRLNTAEDMQSDSPKKRGKFAKFFMETVPETVKKTACVIGFAVGMTVVAVACGSASKYKIGDADIDSDAPADVADTDSPDVIGDEIEETDATPCSGVYEELEGTVNPIIARTAANPVDLNGPEEASVSGTAEFTIGGSVEGDGLLHLGNCPDDENAVAAFGAQGTSVAIVPSWRIDVADGFAQMPEVDGVSCVPPESVPPISMFNDEANITLIPALVGSVDGSAEVGFSTPVTASIIDGVSGLELSVPLMLEGNGYVVTSFAVYSNSLARAGAKVLSGEGTELLSSEVNGSVGSARSKTFEIVQIGDSDTILPTLDGWRPVRAPGPDGTMIETAGPEGSLYVCLAPCSPDSPYTAVELPVQISPDVINAAVSNSCGDLFAAFDIVSISAAFLETDDFVRGFKPPHLASNYSLSADLHYGDGAAMGETPIVYLYVRRAASAFTGGDEVVMLIEATVTIESRDVNPATGAKETAEFIFQFKLSVPSYGDYHDVCGCNESI